MRSLSDAIYCATHHSDVDAKTIAEILGVRYSYLLDAANPDRDDTQFQARLIMPLTRATGNFVLIKFISRSINGCFFELPKPSEHDGELASDFAPGLVQAFGALLGALAAVEGTQTTVHDAARIYSHADGLIELLARLKSVVEARVPRSLATALRSQAG